MVTIVPGEKLNLSFSKFWKIELEKVNNLPSSMGAVMPGDGGSSSSSLLQSKKITQRLNQELKRIK